MVIKFEQEYEIEIHFNVPFFFYNTFIRYKKKFHAAQSSGSKGLMTRYVHFHFLQTSNLLEVNHKSVLHITINLRPKTPPKVLHPCCASFQVSL